MKYSCRPRGGRSVRGELAHLVAQDAVDPLLAGLSTRMRRRVTSPSTDQSSGLVVLEGGDDLLLRVHDEGPIGEDRLVDRFASEREHSKVRLRGDRQFISLARLVPGDLARADRAAADLALARNPLHEAAILPPHL